MANFLKTANTSGIKFHSNSFSGSIGEGITKETLNSFAKSLYVFSTNENIKTFILGYSSKAFPFTAADWLMASIADLGLNVIKPNLPCMLNQTSWLQNQTKEKTIGIYLGHSIFTENKLEITIFDSEGDILSKKGLIKLFTVKNKIKIIGDMLPGEIKEVDLGLYSKYLIDKKLVKNIGRLTDIDLMFGSGEQIFTKLKTDFNFNYQLFNLNSLHPRLLNYRSNPTDKELKWYTTYGIVNPTDLFFAVSGSGDRFGIYDLKQNIELSSDSICLLLLKYLHYFQKTQGTVIFSAGLSKNVFNFAKRLKFNIIKTKNSIIDTIHQLNKPFSSILLTADNTQKFSLNNNGIPETVISINAIRELCSVLNKGPADIIDDIFKELKKPYHAQHIAVYNMEILEKLFNKKIKNLYTEFTEKTSKTHITITLHELLDCAIIKVENKNKEITIKTFNDLQSKIGQCLEKFI